MKKSLLLPLFIITIMVISLSPQMIAQPTTENLSEPSFESELSLVQDPLGDDNPFLRSQSLKERFLSTNPTTQKTDKILSDWLSTGEDGLLHKINGNPSVMLMVSGDDPTLGGTITPLGSFAFGDTGLHWVHTSADREQVIELSQMDHVLRLEGDKIYNQDLLDDPISQLQAESAALPQFSEPFYANDIIGATYVEETFGYNGTGTVVNVMDSGVDFGQTALQGVLALDSNNASASFGGFGLQVALSQLYTRNTYLEEGNTAKAAGFDPLHSNATGYIDTSNLDDLKVWLSIFTFMSTVGDTGIPWMPEIPLPDQYYVGNLPGNNTGYSFGFAFLLNGGFFIISPFLQADTDNNGDYDTMYVDYESARHYSILFENTLAGSSFITQKRILFNNAPFNFTKSPAHTNDNHQVLAADFLDDELEGTDGFNDLSLGALSNTYDQNNFTGRLGISDPIIRGIDHEGIGFAFFSDIDTHGTAVAGEIAARPINYTLSNDQVINVGGAAPGTDIIGTIFFSDSAFIYSNLWVTGYEPQANLDWQFVNDHIANITSNSWGISNFEFEDDFAFMYDFRTLFLDLLSQPGFVNGDHPGIVVVFSAGNAGPGYGTLASAPMGGTFITVGATTAFGWVEEPGLGLFGFEWAEDNQGFDEIVGFSSTGPGTINYPKIDVVNIGAFDFSISPTNSTGSSVSLPTLFSGTSEAAPLTSGVLSQVFQAWYDDRGTALQPDMAKVILKSTAVDLGFDAYQQGAGRVDAARAVHAILNGSLPSGEELFFAHSTDSLDILGNKLNNAFNHWFGTSDDLNVTGYSGLDYPTITQDIKDTGLFGGSIQAGDSTSLSLTVNTSTVDSFESFSFDTIYNDSVGPFVSTSQYKYHKLYDLLDETQFSGAENFQITVSFSDETIEARDNLGFYPWLYLMNIEDLDSDGIIDDNERSIFNLGISSYNTSGLFFSSRLFTENSYLVVWDLADYIADQVVTVESPGDLEYEIGLRVFDRVITSDVTVSGTSSPYTVSFNPAANADPGYHQGYIKINGASGGSSLVPYTYTVPLEVDDYDVNGFAEVSGARNVPFENGVYPAVDFASRFNTGDWRYYDLKIIGATSSANSLGIEVEWTYPDTMVDVYILDNDGRVIETSKINYLGAGVFASDANTASTLQRFLVNLTGYRTGDTLSGGDFSNGYDTFTLALHATQVDKDALPFDPISIRAAWVGETISEWNIPEPTLITTGSISDYNGIPVTDDTIGAEWSSVTTNPIPSFTNNEVGISLDVFKNTRIQENRTIPKEELVSYAENDNSIDPEWTQDLFIEAGSTLEATLDWEHASSDFDFILIEKGADPSFANDIFGADLATSDRPEQGRARITTSGTYTLVVEWFSGNAALDQPFSLDFVARQSIFEDDTSTDKTLTIDLSQTDFSNLEYSLVTSTSGWNFEDEIELKFIYDNQGPLPTYEGGISEDASGNVVIGTISDAVPYNYTLSFDGTTVSSGNNVEGRINLVIDSDLVTGILEDNTFTFNGIDAFGQTSSHSIVVFREDQSDPVISSTPGDQIDILVNEPTDVEYVIEDASEGDYSIIFNGQEIGSGTWVGGETTVITLNFENTGEFLLRIEFTDLGGNSAVHILRVNVMENTQPTSSTTDEGGGLPFANPFVVALTIVAIPIIRRKFR